MPPAFSFDGSEVTTWGPMTQSHAFEPASGRSRTPQRILGKIHLEADNVVDISETCRKRLVSEIHKLSASLSCDQPPWGVTNIVPPSGLEPFLVNLRRVRHALVQRLQRLASQIDQRKESVITEAHELLNAISSNLDAEAELLQADAEG